MSSLISDWVLIDTCLWVSYFNRRHSIEHRVIDALLDADQAATTGVILAEVLQGFRRDDQADWVASSLSGLHYLQPDWDDWRATAKLGRRLNASGQILPLTDLVVSAIAIRRECAVFTIDPHFDLISELKRFRPS